MEEAADYYSSGVVTNFVPLFLRLPLPGERLYHPMKRQLAELFNVRLKHPGVVHESWNSSAISGHVTNGLWPGKVSKQRELVEVAVDGAEGYSSRLRRG